MINDRMLPWLAPRAMRTPISLVRWRTTCEHAVEANQREDGRHSTKTGSEST